MPEDSISHKEQRIRKITNLYYSRRDIQNVIFDFSKNREVVPRYFEGFGKRPDSLQYSGDVFEMAKKGATSFHCSEELWSDPFQIQTEMNQEQLNNLRIGWDLLIDIDSKYLDYSKICADIVVSILKFHRVKNIGVKFSGSKGFHILVPWKSFPGEVSGVKTSDMFPEYPRAITKYIMEKINSQLIERISKLERPNRYVKDFRVSEKVVPDLVLVSPRHLFRMPYSLHEKTALASVPINPEKVLDFEVIDADPMKAKIRNFCPESREGEARELLMQALDWSREHQISQGDSEMKTTGKHSDFKPVRIDNLSENNFPPCIKNILKGISDGKKRALFILINFFRSLDLEKGELEKKIHQWNEKNKPPLKEGYLISQLSWAYKKKPLMPPNCKEFYQGIAVCTPDEFCPRIKNPVNYTVRKSFTISKNNLKNSE